MYDASMGIASVSVNTKVVGLGSQSTAVAVLASSGATCSKLRRTRCSRNISPIKKGSRVCTCSPIKPYKSKKIVVSNKPKKRTTAKKKGDTGTTSSESTKINDSGPSTDWFGRASSSDTVDGPHGKKHNGVTKAGSSSSLAHDDEGCAPSLVPSSPLADEPTSHMSSPQAPAPVPTTVIRYDTSDVFLVADDSDSSEIMELLNTPLFGSDSGSSICSLDMTPSTPATSFGSDGLADDRSFVQTRQEVPAFMMVAGNGMNVGMLTVSAPRAYYPNGLPTTMFPSIEYLWKVNDEPHGPMMDSLPPPTFDALVRMEE